MSTQPPVVVSGWTAGTRYPQSEMLDDALYDYQRFAAGVKYANFFQVPIGVNGRTVEDTNMVWELGTPYPGRLGVVLHGMRQRQTV